MSILTTLTSFEGRMRRRTFLKICLVFIVVSIAGQVLLSPSDYFTNIDVRTPFSVVLFNLILLIPATAITVRRVNDIEWSANWAFGLTVAALLFYLFDYLRPFGSLGTINTGNVTVWVLLLIAAAVSLMIGFKRGTPGTNAHGPDPRVAA